MKTLVLTILFMMGFAVGAHADCLNDYQATIARYTSLVQQEQENYNQLQAREPTGFTHLDNKLSNDVLFVKAWSRTLASWPNCFSGDITTWSQSCGLTPNPEYDAAKTFSMKNYIDGEMSMTAERLQAFNYYLAGLQKAYALLKTEASISQPSNLRDLLIKRGNQNGDFCKTYNSLDTDTAINTKIEYIIQNQVSISDQQAVEQDVKTLDQTYPDLAPTLYVSDVIGGPAK